MKRRRFQRTLGKRRYKKLFIISIEGDKTEYEYFKNLEKIESFKSIIHINCLKSRKKSSPSQVLKRMLEYLKTESLKTGDEAWLVVDKDTWTTEQLNELYAWSLKAKNHGFALSNPQFEYWLLLHFEDGNDIGTANDCCMRLLKYLPDYNKEIDLKKITLERIYCAIRRAKNRDHPPCNDWPRNIGTTTVYKLVENIFLTMNEVLEEQPQLECLIE